MTVEIEDISVDTESLAQTLTIAVNIKFYPQIEVPLSITGTLKTADGKRISSLKESDIYNNRNYTFQLDTLANTTRNNIFSGQLNVYACKLAAPLSHQAIEHIEYLRELNSSKAVSLTFDFIVKSIETTNNERSHIFRATKHGRTIEINQSDWINKFTKHLKIGNFLLLELQIPNKRQVEPEWSELYDRLFQRLEEMEMHIRSGNWLETMKVGRQFYENINFSERKIGQKAYAGNLKDLFLKDHHSEQGFDDFAKGIRSFFDFLSKYIHDNDKDGKFHSVPVATKEEAYMAYSLSVGLLNIIGKKISRYF